MKLTMETTLADIVRAMPEEWRDRLRAAKEAGEVPEAGSMLGPRGKRCLMGIALGVNEREVDMVRAYDTARKFFDKPLWWPDLDYLHNQAEANGVSVWDRIGDAL